MNNETKLKQEQFASLNYGAKANGSKESIEDSECESKDDSLDESLEDGNSGCTDFIEPKYFTKVKGQIEKNLNDMAEVIDDLSKMREQAASLESNLVSRIDCSTWENVSEFIGISSSTMIDQCMKILDHGDEENAEWNVL